MPQPVPRARGGADPRHQVPHHGPELGGERGRGFPHNLAVGPLLAAEHGILAIRVDAQHVHVAQPVVLRRVLPDDLQVFQFGYLAPVSVTMLVNLQQDGKVREAEEQVRPADQLAGAYVGVVIDKVALEVFMR